MKTILFSIALIAPVLFFMNCKKDSSSGYNIAFYSGDTLSNYQLIFDSTNKGHLPFVSGGANDCGDSRALRITSLGAGTHTVLAVDSLGLIQASGTLSLANNEISFNGTKGSTTSISLNGCGAIGLAK